MERPSEELLAQVEARRKQREAEAAKIDPGPAVWYVGIAGEPVGPVDKAFLKGQIDDKKVTATSLVWREELTDWKPLNTFPELRELLSARAPLAATPSDAASAPLALTHAKEVAPKSSKPESLKTSALGLGPTPVQRALGDDPDAPSKPSAPSGPSAASPSSAETASESAASEGALVGSAASTLDTDLEPPPSVGMPLGLAGLAPPPSMKPAPTKEPAPKPAPAPPTSVDSGPGMDLAPEPAPEPDDDDLALAGIPPDKRRGLSPMAVAFIAMATAFGAVSAWFLFGADDGRVAQGTGGDVVAPPTTDGDGTTPSDDGSPSDDGGSGEPEGSANPEGGEDDGAVTGNGNGNGNGGKVASTGGKTSPTTQTGGEDDGGSTKPVPKPCSPDDPFCDKGPSGPSATPDDDGGSGSGAGLSQAQAQSVVSRYKGSLMRRCRSMVTKGSAKVGATIVVGPSGAVKSAAVSGGSDYPGLASCVKARIMNWSFPSSGGSTTINVSFNFL